MKSGYDTYCFVVFTKVLASNAPKVISVRAGYQGGIGTSTWRSLYKLFRYSMSCLPFLSHLLETKVDLERGDADVPGRPNQFKDIFEIFIVVIIVRA